MNGPPIEVTITISDVICVWFFVFYILLTFWIFICVNSMFFTLNSDSAFYYIKTVILYIIISNHSSVFYYPKNWLSIFSQSNSKMTMKLNELSVGEPLVNQQRIQHWAAKVWSRNNKVFKIVWKFSTIMWVPILYLKIQNILLIPLCRYRLDVDSFGKFQSNHDNLCILNIYWYWCSLLSATELSICRYDSHYWYVSIVHTHDPSH